MGKVLEANIGRRGSVIHDGNVSIKFNPVEAKFEFSKDSIVNIAETGFTEACDWVNKIYEQMYKGLNYY